MERQKEIGSCGYAEPTDADQPLTMLLPMAGDSAQEIIRKFHETARRFGRFRSMVCSVAIGFASLRLSALSLFLLFQKAESREVHGLQRTTQADSSSWDDGAVGDRPFVVGDVSLGCPPTIPEMLVSVRAHRERDRHDHAW